MPANIDDYAVIVGVNHYAELATLKGPDKDAKRFHNWVVDEKGGYVPPDNCYLVLSEKDSLLPIQYTIDQCFGKINSRTKRRKGRRLYFYFSGHGLGLSWNDTALVLPQWDTFFRNHALSSGDYRTTLIESGIFSEIFFFFDCCRNRKVAVNGAPPSFGNVMPAATAGACRSYVYSASEFTNQAYEALIQSESGSLQEDGIRGIFTESLLRGLRGAAEKDGKITSLSLANHLERDLPKIAAQTKKVQVPNIQGDHADTTIIDGLTVNITNVQITFTVSGKKAILEDSELKVLKEGISDVNEPWTVDLYKGLYTIYYEDEQSFAKMIRIDGTLKTVSYGI
ncbi:caspase family protein [Chryseobacterium sp. Marseille-Q3244]|uniref:caspase family protein n=1 Tax=Chryseobacterium sp. Marseille-Q3244 TaxID=2758092 RepID=UPI002024643A|nr:caspase family protein [Chryseobacterium sp. Marseille-Q3244]